MKKFNKPSKGGSSSQKEGKEEAKVRGESDSCVKSSTADKRQTKRIKEDTIEISDEKVASKGKRKITAKENHAPVENIESSEEEKLESEESEVEETVSRRSKRNRKSSECENQEKNQAVKKGRKEKQKKDASSPKRRKRTFSEDMSESEDESEGEGKYIIYITLKLSKLIIFVYHFYETKG